VDLVFLLAREFLCGLLHHYKIELVHLNPNSILQITIFVHLYETYLTVHPNFSLFKHYSFLKYQPSAAKQKVISSVGIESCPHHDFLDLPLKSSLKGWHRQWFYCKNHEPSLPPFVGWLPEYDTTWVDEPMYSEMLIISALSSRVSELKVFGLIGVCVATNWLACRVIPLKKQVHPMWEYNGLQDPTRESGDNIEASKLVELLGEMFQSISSWSTSKSVHTYHLQVARDLVRQYCLNFLDHILIIYSSYACL
jgi:hypothetical protein